MASNHGEIVSVNASPGGVPKRPVPRAAVSAAGLQGDRQRDLRFHGGPDRALCLYSMDRIEALQAEGHPIAPGTAGENLTIRGLDWDLVVPGAVLHVGSIALEVTAYAAPCKTIRGSFSDHDSNRISQKKFPGWSRVYVRVLGESMLAVGDHVDLNP